MMDNLRGLTVECEGKRGVVTWQSIPPLPSFVHITFFDNSRGLKFLEDVKVIKRPTKCEFMDALDNYIDTVRETCYNSCSGEPSGWHIDQETRREEELMSMIDGLDFEVDYNEAN